MVSLDVLSVRGYIYVTKFAESLPGKLKCLFKEWAAARLELCGYSRYEKKKNSVVQFNTDKELFVQRGSS